MLLQKWNEFKITELLQNQNRLTAEIGTLKGIYDPEKKY